MVLTWTLAIVTGATNSVRSIALRTWLFLVWSGAATGLSWLCYYRALQLGKASQVAPIDKFSLAMVVVLAAIFLNEPLTLKSIVGAALIVAGTLVFVL